MQRGWKWGWLPGQRRPAEVAAAAAEAGRAQGARSLMNGVGPTERDARGSARVEAKRWGGRQGKPVPTAG